jgi:hypothetical protein
MFFTRYRARIARSVVGFIAAGFIQVGMSAPVANAAPLAAPTITSVTATATTMTVNMQTAGVAASSWRYILTRQRVSGCATSLTDGAVNSTASLVSSFTITGLTSGCHYTVKVAGFNGVIGAYAAADELVGGFINGLEFYAKNETGASTGMSRTPFTTGLCSSAGQTVTNIDIDYAAGGPSGCNVDGFTSYYHGYIKAPFTGVVNFRVWSDDGFFLNIQGQNVISYTSDVAATLYNASGSISMVANEVYRIEAWHHDKDVNSGIKLYWDWTGQSTVIVPSASLATDPSLLRADGGCPIGTAARCAAGSALEIKRATGTNMDGQYWININGTPTLVFCVMNSSQGGGGWMLAMRGKNASSTFQYNSAYWTDSNLLNSSYPQRFSASDTINTFRNTDAKYEPFVQLPGNQVMVLYPEVTDKAGGAFGTNGSANATGVNSVKYGFAWHETFTTGTAWTSYNSSTKWGGTSWNIAHTGGPSSTPSCVTSPKTLNNLFNESNRCAFRRVNSNYVSTESPYSAVGDNVFFSQTNIRFFGINYANAATGFASKARIGFGWNENGPGDESSNDGNGGIGLFSTNSSSMAAGTFNGCCSSTVNAADANIAGQTGLSGGDNTTRQLGFELYVRNSTELSVGGNSRLRVTQGRSTSMVAGTGYTIGNNTGSTTIRLSSVRDGFSIDPTSGVVTVSEALPVGVYTTTVSATDANNATGTTSLTITVLADASETDNALSFNGSQSLSTVGTIGLWADQTWEAWVRPTTTCSGSGNATVLGTSNFVIFCNSSDWWLSFKDSGGGWNGYKTSLRVVQNEWVHLAVVRSSSNISMFANNKRVKIFVSSAWVDSYSQTIRNEFPSVVIGGTGAAGQFFTGVIDEVKIWSEARTLTQIWNGAHQAENIGSSALLMYWDFNEGTGSAISRSQRSDDNFNFVPLNANQWVPVATTSTSGPYTVVTVPRTLINKVGGWRAPESLTALTALVLGGGGGGGGGYQGGGGGAGGFLEATVAIDPRSVYEIRVGVGGVGAANPDIASNGDTSTAFGMTAVGGGSGMSEFTVNTVNVQYNAASGGSGGGASHGTVRTAGTGINGQGNAGAFGRDIFPTCSQLAGGGGGGAGSAGFEAICSDPAVSNTTHGGYGGSPKLSVVTGTFKAGGGGGSLRAGGTSLAAGLGGNGIAGTAGDSSYISGAAVGATGGATHAPVGSGGGGGAGNSTDGATGYGGNGGSGTVTFRYITAFKPTYTPPTNAFLNVGMTETFTVNVAQDSATAMLTRTFRWESTTAGSGGTYSVIKQGTGAANAAFSWVPSDTSTSGSQYLFRVIVTDSDTAGLFIQDTSTAVFATINRALVLSGKSSITKTVNVSKSETFTVTLGTPTYRYTFTNNSPLITLDTSTAGSPRIRLADTITVGTYLETLTVIDSVSATIVQPLTITVNAPPSFSANGEQVDSGTVLYLDAGNLQSNTGTGSTWRDISGRGLTASFPPSPAPPMNLVTSGLSCSAPTYNSANLGSLLFGGSQCGYVPNVGLLKVYTYEVWVRRSADMTDYSSVMANPWSGATGQQISITLHWMANGTIQAGIFDGTTWSNVANSPVIDIGVWTHVAVTYTGSTLSMILNGNIAGKISVARTLTWVDAKNDTGIIIGKRFDLNADYFKGSIASVRVYNRVLTDSELLQNYNATKGRFLTTQNKQSVAGKYGTTVNETYTVTSGSETITATFTSSAVAGLIWDTSTVRSMKVQLQDSLTAGTYYDTVTVTDTYGSSTRIALSFVIAKADTITVTMDTATVTVYNGSPITQYPKPTIRGLKNSDTATVTTKFSSTSYSLSATVPTNADTYTVIATDISFQVGLQSNYLAVVYETSTARINKANQKPLNVSLYGGVVGSPFTITLLGGSGDGVVTETLTGVATAPNCAISNKVLTSSATTTSYCELRVVKAESQNYLLESATVQVYFMAYVFSQPTNQVGSGPGIGLTGATSVALSPNAAPTISAIEYVAAVCINSFCIPEHWIIRGSGFGATYNLDTVVKFWRNKTATLTTNSNSNHVIDDTSIKIWSLPGGATTGKITVTTANGIAVSVDNWIAP